MTAQQTEGQRLALEPLEPKDLEVSVFKSKPSIDRKTPSAESTDSPLFKNVTVSVIQNNGRVYFKFENRNNLAVWVDASLEGRPVETEDNVSYTYTSQDSVAKLGLRPETISNKFIRTAAQAAHFAWSYMRRKALTGGEFTSIKMLKNLHMDWTIGTQLILRETTTAETGGLRHVIIGEDFSTDSGTLTVTYQLARLFQPTAGAYATYTRHYTGASPFGNPIVNFVSNDDAKVMPPDSLRVERYGADDRETALRWNRQCADGLFFFNALPDQFTALDGSQTSRAKLSDAANYVTAKVDLVNLGYNRHFVRPFQRNMVRLSPTTILGSALQPAAGLMNNDRFLSSIASGAKAWATIPVVPNELYEYTMGFLYEDATSSVEVFALADGATWGPGMTVWDNLCSSWSTHTSAAVDSINTLRNVEVHTVKFQAQETTAGAADSVPPVRTVGFTYSPPNAFGMPAGLIAYERMLRMTRRNAKRQIRTTDGLQVYATAFLRGLNTRSITYTLNVYSGQTGFLVGSASSGVTGGALTKLSVAVPANHTHLWATLVPTTAAFSDVPADVLIVGHGFTDFNPSTPAAMYQPSGLVNRIY